MMTWMSECVFVSTRCYTLYVAQGVYKTTNIVFINTFWQGRVLKKKKKLGQQLGRRLKKTSPEMNRGVRFCTPRVTFMTPARDLLGHFMTLRNPRVNCVTPGVTL